jgi:hypothetical protein
MTAFVKFDSHLAAIPLNSPDFRALCRYWHAGCVPLSQFPSQYRQTGGTAVLGMPWRTIDDWNEGTE